MANTGEPIEGITVDTHGATSDVVDHPGIQRPEGLPPPIGDTPREVQALEIAPEQAPPGQRESYHQTQGDNASCRDRCGFRRSWR